MEVHVDKRVVIEMTPDEAAEFYRAHRPKPGSVGAKLDKAIHAALEAADAWPDA
jgi:hypothetical protein